MEEQTDNKTDRIKARLDEYNAEMDKLRKKNEKLEEQLSAHQKELSERAIDGEGDGTTPKPKEETPEEYAKRVMAGKI